MDSAAVLSLRRPSPKTCSDVNRRRLALLLLASSAGMLSATCGSDAAPSASAESEPPPAELTAETQPGVEGNERPVITSLRFDPERPGPTGSVRAMVDVSDPDGDPVELAYTWIVNGRSVSGDGPELQRPVGRGDFVRVGVVASDGEDEAEPVELSEVEIANAAPWIDSEPGAPGPGRGIPLPGLGRRHRPRHAAPLQPRAGPGRDDGERAQWARPAGRPAPSSRADTGSRSPCAIRAAPPAPRASS